MAAEVDDRGVWFGLAKRFVFNSIVCKKKTEQQLEKKKILCNFLGLAACLYALGLPLIGGVCGHTQASHHYP